MRLTTSFGHAFGCILCWLQCNIKNITWSATLNAVKTPGLGIPLLLGTFACRYWEYGRVMYCEEINLYSEWKKNRMLGFTTGIYPNHWSCSKKDKPWWKGTTLYQPWWHDTVGNVDTAYLKTLRMIVISREHGAQLSNGLDKCPKNKLWWLSRQVLSSTGHDKVWTAVCTFMWHATTNLDTGFH